MSTPSSPKYSAAMLLAPAHHHHNHNNTIKTPKNYDSPKLMAMGISGGGGVGGGSSLSNNASTSSSSSNLNSNLIIDNQGQVHDPGYLDALRQLHQQIGQNAIGEKDHSRRRSETKRRTSSMATAGSSHVPSRPSALGLGLTSNDINKLNLRGSRNGNYSSSSDDDDDEDEEDWDSYTSLFEDAKKRDAQIHRANSMAAAYTPTGFLNTASAYNSPRYNNSPLPSTNSYNSNGVSPASTPIFGNGGGSGHVSPRRDSQSGSTSTAMNGNSVHRPSLAFALNADLEEEINEAANASGSSKISSRGRKSDRSTTSSTKSASRRLSLPSHRSNSPPLLGGGAHSIIAPKATYGATTMSSVSPLRKDDDWGFTGIVDVERERKQLSNQLGSKIDPYHPSRSNSLFDDDDDDSLPAPTKSAPDSPSLVAAASLHRSLRTPPLNEKLGSSSTNVNRTNSTSRKLRAASFSQNKSKSVMKKPSNSDVASISSNSIRHAGDSSPNHPFLSSKDATTPPAGGIQSRKGSLSAAVGNTLRSKSPSLRQKFNYRKGSSRSRPSSSGSAQYQPSSSFQNIHNKSSPTSATEIIGAERPREFNAMDNHDRLGGGAGLSTIQSGRLLDGGNHKSIQSSLTSDSNIQNNNNHDIGGVPNSMPASRTSLSSLSTSAKERLERELQSHQQKQNQQPSSSVIDSSSSTRIGVDGEDRNVPDEYDQIYQIDDLENGMGTGTGTTGGISKKAHEIGEYASQQSHDLRRKMDIFTMGLRFNAFKAKRKFERGFKHNET